MRIVVLRLVYAHNRSRVFNTHGREHVGESSLFSFGSLSDFKEEGKRDVCRVKSPEVAHGNIREAVSNVCRSPTVGSVVCITCERVPVSVRVCVCVSHFSHSICCGVAGK